MCAITRSGQLVAECARVERCLYVNLLRRLRRVFGVVGEERKGCEEDILGLSLLCSDVDQHSEEICSQKSYFTDAMYSLRNVEAVGSRVNDEVA